jgi:hypothetical protein
MSINGMMDKFGGYLGKKFEETGFFYTKKSDGRWLLIDPQGHPFFMVGIAHVEDSCIKHEENIHIYKAKYGSREKWISDCVVKSLKDWGFNTLAWTKQWVAVGMRHSPEWTPEEYRDSGLAYIPHIDFLNIERWNEQAVYMDVFSSEFEEWCDYQARYWCASLADDPNLIGYAYTARPHWDVTKLLENTSWTPEQGNESEFLSKVIARYYKVTYDAIRKYDKNHLIFGDLVEGCDCLPQGPGGQPLAVFSEMQKYVDVLSVNWYHPFDVMKETIEEWQKICDKPVFLSDSAFVAPNDLLTIDEPLFDGGWEKLRVQNESERGAAYIDMISKAANSGYIIGWGWCGFMQNKVRKYGLKDRFDQPSECTEIMAEFNRNLYENLGLANAIK